MASAPPQTRSSQPVNPPNNMFGPIVAPTTPGESAATREHQVVAGLGLNTQDVTVISSALVNKLQAINVPKNLTKGKDPKIKFSASSLKVIIAIASHLKQILSSDSTLCVLVCKLGDQVTSLS
ncbi:hypothetical protein FRB95_000655 [Tulasnella sp. JGI-2019a]|nr:hypothetical protein FRB95_000655 [Tulasnella sp. JGI-2019a]